MANVHRFVFTDAEKKVLKHVGVKKTLQHIEADVDEYAKEYAHAKSQHPEEDIATLRARVLARMTYRVHKDDTDLPVKWHIENSQSYLPLGIFGLFLLILLLVKLLGH